MGYRPDFTWYNETHIEAECGITTEYLASGCYASVHTPTNDNSAVIYTTDTQDEFKFDTLFFFDLVLDILWCEFSPTTTRKQYTLKIKRLKSVPGMLSPEYDPVFDGVQAFFYDKMTDCCGGRFSWCENIPHEFWLDIATSPELETFDYLRMWAAFVYENSAPHDMHLCFDFKAENWLYDPDKDQYLPIDGVYNRRA